MNHAADQILRGIQRTIWKAPIHGASRASITLTNDEIRYQDNAIPHGRILTWDVSDARFTRPRSLAGMIRDSVAPRNLHATFTDLTKDKPQEKTLTKIGDGTIRTRHTRDRRYNVHLTKKQSAEVLRIVNTDGTLRYDKRQIRMAAWVADSQMPGSTCKHQYYAAIAEPTNTWQYPADGVTADDIMETLGELFCEEIEDINAAGGAAWTEQAVPFQDMPQFHDRVNDDQGPDTVIAIEPIQHITRPERVIRVRAQQRMERSITLAWLRNGPPEDQGILTKGYSPPDPRDANLTIIAANITHPDGSTERLVPPDKDEQNATDRSRFQRVERIELELEMTEPDGDTATHRLDAPIYTAYAGEETILMVARDHDLTDDEVAKMADTDIYLWPDFYEASETIHRLQLRQLCGDGTPQPPEPALQKIADSLAATMLAPTDQATSATATSTDGRVTVTIAGP